MNKKAVFLILLLAIYGPGCKKDGVPVSDHPEHQHSADSSDEGVVRLSDAAADFAGIRDGLAKAKFRECPTIHTAMGKVLAPQPRTAIVSQAFPARVAEVHVKLGDSVETGDRLVTLECHEVGTAKSEFYKALADRELAELTLARQERLSENGIGVKKNLLAAETEYKIAESNAEAAHKRLHVLGFTDEQVDQIAETHQLNPAITLYSPISGKVVTNQAVPGAFIDQLTEILTIVDLTVLWVDAEIYEQDIGKVKIGQKVEVEVPAYPGEKFPGKVVYVGDVVSEETRKMIVRAEVANEELADGQYRLKPGMFADVDIILNGNCRMLVVPLDAVLEDRDQKLVFVNQEDRFERREVKTGIVIRASQTGAVDRDYQQILDGLDAGEEVVTDGNYQLYSELKEDVLKAAEVH